MSVLDIKIYQDWPSDRPYQFNWDCTEQEVVAAMELCARAIEATKEEIRLNEEWKAKRAAVRAGSPALMGPICIGCGTEITDENNLGFYRMNPANHIRIECIECTRRNAHLAS